MSVGEFFMFLIKSRKDIAKSADTSEVLAEQREIKKEKLLASKGMFAGLAVFALIALCAFLIPLITGVDPDATAPVDRLKSPSDTHLFGTDEFGRDLFTRVCYGAQSSLWVGLCVALFSCFCGVVIGVLAAYYKWLDQILMRICDGLIAIPGIMLAVAFMAAFGTTSWNVIWALTIVYIPSVARMVRASALVAKQQMYVEAAKVQGASNARILVKHILPNVISPLIVQATFIFAQAIISEASLSFLGAGIPAPAASWGNILEASKAVLTKAPWTALIPGTVVVACVLSLNLFGDGLRDYLDPKTSNGN